MKTITEYLQKGHIQHYKLSEIITNKRPSVNYNDYMCIRIPYSNNTYASYYILYTDLVNIEPKEIIDYFYELYDKGKIKYGKSEIDDSCICFQFYSDRYHDYVTGYYLNTIDDNHILQCFIDNPIYDKENEYKQIQYYFEQ